MKKRKKLSRYWRFTIAFAIFILVLNIAVQFEAFCDFYTDHIFWLGSETYGRLTGTFSFSVGEVLLVMAILSVLIAIVCLILLVFVRKNEWHRCLMKRYLKGELLFVLLILLIMTLNCSVLYGCSRLNVNGNRGKTYDVSQAIILRNYIVEKCNELSGQVLRGLDGNPIYPGNVDKEIREAMWKLAEKYPRLSGYYPDPKPIRGSYLMYQTGTVGVYFPFSMEANYNSYISDVVYPEVICHELAHLKGYIYEDEANFISYFACTESDNRFLQYSGYMGVLSYLEKDILEVLSQEEYDKLPPVDEQVYTDMSTYTEEAYEEIKSHKEWIDTETVVKMEEQYTDAYMTYYGAEANYSEVSRRLLEYYDGILY